MRALVESMSGWLADLIALGEMFPECYPPPEQLCTCTLTPQCHIHDRLHEEP